MLIPTRSTRDMHAFKALLDQYVAASRVTPSSRELAELHSTSQTAYACSELRADTLAQVPFVPKLNGELIEGQHPLKEIFSGKQDIATKIRRTEWSLCYWGHSLLVKQRNVFGTPRELRWLNPTLYDKDVRTEGLIGFRVYRGNYKVVPDLFVYRQDAIYQHGLDFKDDFDGVGSAEVAFLQAGLEPEIAQTVLSFFRNLAIPAAIVQPAAKSETGYNSSYDQTDMNAFRAFLKRVVQGAMNAGRTILTPDRYEWLTLQRPFDELAMPELNKSAKESICQAFKVPYDLIVSNGNNYGAALEVTYRKWGQTWLVNQAKWYAEQFTWQLAQEFGEGYTIEADLDAVPFLKEDTTTRVTTAATKVEKGFTSLYDAQVELGEKPNEAFRELYYYPDVGYVPVSEFANVWKLKLAPPSPFGNMTTGVPPAEQQPTLSVPPATVTTGDVLPESKPTQEAETPLPRITEKAWISEDVYAELKNWQYKVARKGVKAAFECKHVRVDVERRLLERLATADNEDAVKAAFEYARELSAEKAVQATRLDFENDFEDLLAAARDESNPLPVARFRLILRDMLRKHGTQAYRDGLIDGGVADAEFDDEDEATLNQMLAAQSVYVRELSDTLYKQDGVSDAQAEAKPAMWWSKSLQPIYQAGLLSADKNSNYMWTLGNTEEHCTTCKTLDGQVHRLREYSKRNLLPNSNILACGGWACDCRIVKTKERARGKFPVVTVKSHEHHEHSIHGVPAAPITAEQFEHIDANDGIDDSHLLEPEKQKNEDA